MAKNKLSAGSGSSVSQMVDIIVDDGSCFLALNHSGDCSYHVINGKCPMILRYDACQSESFIQFFPADKVQVICGEIVKASGYIFLDFCCPAFLFILFEKPFRSIFSVHFGIQLSFGFDRSGNVFLRYWPAFFAENIIKFPVSTFPERCGSKSIIRKGQYAQERCEGNQNSSVVLD